MDYGNEEGELSFRQKIRALAPGMILLAGLMGGVPMRPEEIEELLAQTSRPKIVHVLRQQDDDSERLD